MESRICRNCGKSFIPKVGNQVFCNECKTGYDFCPVCGKKKKILNKFCSNSCQAKYSISRPGYVNPGTRSEVKAKIRETFTKKYGATSPWLNKEFKENYENSQVEKRGYAYPFQSEEIQDKVKLTNQTKFGVNYPMESQVFTNKAKAILIKKYGGPSPMYSTDIKEMAKNTLFEKYGNYYCLEAQKLLKGKDSKPNMEFKKLLDQNNIPYDREVKYGGKAFDFKVKDFLIEINPTATHNTVFEVFGKRKIDPSYHFNKSLIANENGFNCLHVWDWDNLDLIINFLKDKPRIYARDCLVSLVSEKQSQEFLDKYHLQGYIKSSLSLGLFYKGSLIEIMTFNKPRYNKKFEFELLRLCSSDFIIVGGASKLLKYFIDNYSPKNIISYCDRSKFSGEVYSNLGFRLLREGKPTRHWYNIKTKKHITDNLLRQLGADRLLGTSYGKGTNNMEILLNSGFVTVYDCGQDTWVLELGQNG